MLRRVNNLHPALLANLAILVVSYAALFTHRDPSTLYRLATIAGGLLLCSAAALTFTHRPLFWLPRPSRSILRATLAVAPWLVLIAIIVMKGRWWTQRSGALRFFTLYLVANWSAMWCLADSRQDSWRCGPRRAVALLATALGILAIDGAALGVTAFGCGVSAALGGVAVIAFAIACRGSRASCLKVFAAAVATFVSVTAVEIAVRFVHLGENVQEVNSREYAREFYSLTPPHAVFVNTPKTLDEFGPALIEINSRGIRGPELPVQSADVLLIGDSMIEARQLAWEQTLGPKLQETVRRRGLPLRIVAHGMRGWSPLLEWNWYLKVGRTLHPRMVMLFFFWNDLWTAGDEVSTFTARLRADGRPEYFDVPVDPDWVWFKHVRIMRLTADVWQRLTVAGIRRAFSAATHKPSPGTLDDESADRLARTLTDPPLTAAQLEALLHRPEGELPPDLRELSRQSMWPSLRGLEIWTETQRAAAAKTEEELARFAQDVSADGGRLVIVYVPNPLQVDGDECSVGRLFERVDTKVLLPDKSGIQTWLNDAARRHRIELLDPSTEMHAFHAARSTRNGDRLYLRADCHWAERGHQFMAEYLGRWLERHAPVPR